MRTVIHTQYRENYGAHDWDGKGECPQQWKNKGGSVYVIDDILDAWEVDRIAELFCNDDDYSTEEVVAVIELDSTDKTAWAEWEQPIFLTRSDTYGEYNATRKLVSAWNRDLAPKEFHQESWVALPNNERKDYKCELVKVA